MNISKYENELIFDLPIVYKDLKIYPARVIDYYPFHFFASCLLLDKNSIPDAKIISMSYLEYLYYKTQTDPEKPYVVYLDRLFALVLRDEDFEDVEKSMGRYRVINGKPFFDINGKTYNGSDFEEIKAIICEQNILTPPDETIQKELRDKMEEAEKLRQKVNNTKMASLEDQLVAIAVYTGWDIEKISKLSIRKFSKVLQRADNIMHYQIYLSASMSGMVEFKDKSFIKHWLSDLSYSDKFNGTMVESENMTNKLSFSDKKK